MNPKLIEDEKKSIMQRLKQPKTLFILAIVLTVGILGVIGVNSLVWNSRLVSSSSVSLGNDECGTFLYEIEIETSDDNDVVFGSSVVYEDRGKFYASSSDLFLGDNVLTFTVDRGGHSRLDSLVISNAYTPIILTTTQRTDSRQSTTKLTISTNPGNSLSFMNVDTILADGEFSVEFDPDERLAGFDPDEMPSLVLSEQIKVTNSSGNQRMITEQLVFNFSRVDISISEPWNNYISRTGSGYTIRGSGERGVRVTFYGATTGYVTIGSSGSFSKWVSVPEFGENVFYLYASKDGCTTEVEEIIIYREMTDAEAIRAYKNSCSQLTAEYVRLHQSNLVGDRVRLWGRTVEYFSGNELHLVNGNDHWIADLTNFDQVPSLVGLSCYCWGEVSGQSRSFYTSAGDNVTAPILEAVYFEVSY